MWELTSIKHRVAAHEVCCSREPSEPPALRLASADSYETRSRPTSIQLKNAGGTVLSTQSYTYNAVSNVLTHTQDGVATTYGYDAIDQLTSENRSGYSAGYSYDGQPPFGWGSALLIRFGCLHTQCAAI